ncbi:hypothetical protein SAMN04487948_1109 [Halogranum amylolyticum]|uniref:Uncharacterized protein n=1 Tax=Halogranum amylolyticum TaxID=660520 RepID=A0A1H8U892_9EURY|nr:hypothetical protein [Halogranum amylolyticum]SEO99502.1 hypothetical protein SAMN04487948_1109 [Halogranum amylolyticum]
MAHLPPVERRLSTLSHVIALVSVGVCFFVVVYLSVTAIPYLGVGNRLPLTVSRVILIGLLLVALASSYIAAYAGERLTVSWLPILAMATGMSLFLLVNEQFGLDAVEADLPIQYGILFYFVSALLLSVVMFLLGRGTAWVLSRGG